MTTDKRGLAATLDKLVRDAEDHPAAAQRQTLFRGLRVDVMLKSNQLHVQLSRSNVYPSDQEWRTVLRSLPYAVNGVEPLRMEHGGRFWLRGHWRHVRERQAKLDDAGQGLVEYALLLALVTITVIVILALLGNGIGNAFSNMYMNL